MIAIIDYDAGNLFSVRNALNYLGIENEITREPEKLEQADALILPGVGAFPDAMRLLREKGLVEQIRVLAQKKPFLGICLGMQLLFEKGHEFGVCEGLGLIDGEVVKMEAPGLKIPHMGWNALRMQNPCALLEGVEEGSYVYFVHSYMASTRDENIAAYTEYGAKVPAMVAKGHIFGAQFHPEKSSRVGLRILENFGRLAK